MAAPTTDEQTAASTGTPRHERRIAHFRPEDAAQVAAMFNESDEGWPDGLTHGVEFTAERVLHLHDVRRPLAILIAWEGDTTAGYCTLYEYPEEPGIAGFIGLINVPGRFQGRGYGRDLLKAALRETLLRGYRRLDLGTWSGNMKAVPLYKKSGYYWRPETSVHMQNYMPLLLSVPLLADFWRECDWYQAQVRDLSVREDLHFLGQMRVFPYEFRRGDRFVRAAIDVTSQGLTALETDQWRVSCTVDGRALAIGRARTVRWEVENRTGRPLAVTLLAQAGPGLRLSKEETVVVEHRYATEAFLTADRHFQPPVHGERQPCVETVLLLDGRPLRLETGIEVRPAVEIRLEPPRQNLIPGVPCRIALRCKNTMDEAATLRLALAPADEALPIGAEGYAGRELEVIADAAGVHYLEVWAAVALEGERIDQAPVRLPLPAVTPGRLLALTGDAPEEGSGVRDREVRVESSTHRLVVSLREGAYRIEDARTGSPLASGLVMAGPPFGWTAQARVVHEATCIDSDGALTVCLRGVLPHLPEAAVEHALTLHGDGLVSAITTITNMDSAGKQYRAAVWLWANREMLPTAVLPTIHGLVAADDPGFPDWHEPALRDPAMLRESWMGLQGDGHVAAVLWSEAREIQAGRWSMEVTQETPILAPGATHRLPPIYLYAGHGDWRVARGYWRRLLAPTSPEQHPQPRPLVTMTASRGTWVLLDGENALTLSSLANREAAGTLAFTTPPGWEVTPARQQVTDLRVGQPQQITVRVAAPHDGPAAAHVRATWRTERAVTSVLDGAAIAIGRGDSVTVDEATRDGRQLWTLENGYLRLHVAPSFYGSAVALETVADGANHLHSAFPTAREFGWIRPWYGGIHAAIYRPGRGELPDPAGLDDAEIEARQIEETAPCGRRWRGVEIRGTLRDKDRRGLELGLQYLTAPGSNVLAVRLSIRNRTSAALPVQAALVAHLQPGGTIEGGELLTTASTEGRMLRAQRTVEVPSDGWVAVRNPTTGTVVALIAGGPAADSRLCGIDWGTLGAHAGLAFNPRLGAGEERHILAFLVVARDEAEARAYRALAGTVTLL